MSFNLTHPFWSKSNSCFSRMPKSIVFMSSLDKIFVVIYDGYVESKLKKKGEIRKIER